MSSCIGVDIRRVGKPIDFRCNRDGDLLEVSVSRVGTPLEIRCGLVCSVGSKFYLEVPTESIWLLPENNFSQDVVVYANVSWTIE